MVMDTTNMVVKSRTVTAGGVLAEGIVLEA